jgi:hypothetical protein
VRALHALTIDNRELPDLARALERLAFSLRLTPALVELQAALAA